MIPLRGVTGRESQHHMWSPMPRRILRHNAAVPSVPKTVSLCRRVNQAGWQRGKRSADSQGPLTHFKSKSDPPELCLSQMVIRLCTEVGLASFPATQQCARSYGQPGKPETASSSNSALRNRIHQQVRPLHDKTSTSSM